MKVFKIFMLLLIGVFLTSHAFANVKQLKTYRNVHKEYKPKCIYCHIDDKPKKDEGKHDLNNYGLKLQELMGGEALTEEMVETVGSHEDFESEEVDDDTVQADDGEPMDSQDPDETIKE